MVLTQNVNHVDENILEKRSLEYFVEWEKSCVATASGRILKKKKAAEGDFNF